MKRLFTAACVAALAVGCAPGPDQGPVSSNTSTELEVSIPDRGTEGGQTADAEADANTTLVTLKVPGMT